MNIVLVGNPNAGKTTLYNALTHSEEKTGNWHGVTVEPVEKTVRWFGEPVTVIDVPGLYALHSCSMEEEAAAKTIAAHKQDLIVQVVEARTLPRALRLTRELTDGGYRVVMLITMLSEFRGRLDFKELAAQTVPVLAADVWKDGAEPIKDFLWAHRQIKPRSMGKLELEKFFSAPRLRESCIEKICFHPVAWFPVFVLLLSLAFWLTFGSHAPGVWLKRLTEYGIVDCFGGYLRGVCDGLPPALQGLIFDGIIRGAGGVLSFVPQILILYLCLILMEESGYLSVLSFMADGLLQKVGLSGRSVFSLLMGFGCTSAAILSSRACGGACEQRNIIYALAYVPCSAKLPVFLTLSASVFEHPFLAVLLLYIGGVALALTVAFFRRKKCDIVAVSEVATMRIPQCNQVLKSLFFYAKGYIIKTATVVLSFLVISWFFSSFTVRMEYTDARHSMLAAFCNYFRYLFYPMGITDWQTAYAAFSGLIAKENVAGLLAVFYPNGLPFSTQSAIGFAAFLLVCSPCVSAIASTARELGWRRALALMGIQTGSALLIGTLAYQCAVRPWLGLLLTLPWLVWLFERIYRKRKYRSQKVHG